MNPKDEFLALLDRDIKKYEESVKGWQMLKDHGNYAEQSDALITKYREHGKHLRQLREQIAKES
jgi:septation ring formation regulator EzrA